MEKIYFHPGRKKVDQIPVFTNYYQYQAITYFLRVTEVLDPQFTKDLTDIIPIYTKAEQQHEKLRNSEHSFIDNWEILKKADNQCNSHLLELKNSIIRWAKKYHLVDDSLNNQTFLEIGLWAIPSKRDHPKDIEEHKQFFKTLGREMPKYLLNWSITDSIYIENEEDLEKCKNETQIFTGDEFPFVFTPNSGNIHQYNITGLPIKAGNYENIYNNYEMDLSSALNGKKENIMGYTLGYAWDPRNETWGEFEKKLDGAYKQYKDLYRIRTESLIKKLGYIEGKEKRNKDHFEWLFHYQIKEWTIREIADHYSTKNKILGEDTIKKALHSTASIVGIELR